MVKVEWIFKHSSFFSCDNAKNHRQRIVNIWKSPIVCIDEEILRNKRMCSSVSPSNTLPLLLKPYQGRNCAFVFWWCLIWSIDTNLSCRKKTPLLLDQHVDEDHSKYDTWSVELNLEGIARCSVIPFQIVDTYSIHFDMRHIHDKRIRQWQEEELSYWRRTFDDFLLACSFDFVDNRFNKSKTIGID